MAEKWYLRSPDGDQGPFEFPELLGFIRDGRIGGADEVKCTREGRWIRADVADSQEARISGKAASLPTRGRRGLGAATPGASAAATTHRLTSIVEAVTDRLSPRFVWPVIILAGWLSANYFVAKALDPYAADQESAQQLIRIHDELQRYRQANTTGAEWEAFAARSRRVIEPIVRQLESSASAAHPIRQRLLWASKDCLLPALQNPKKFTQEDFTQGLEKQLQQYLEQASALLRKERGP